MYSGFIVYSFRNTSPFFSPTVFTNTVSPVRPADSAFNAKPPASFVLRTITSAFPLNALILAVLLLVNTDFCWNLLTVDGFPLSTPTIVPLPVKVKRILLSAELTKRPSLSFTSTAI